MTVAAKPLSPQCQRVLDYMCDHDGITSLDAWRFRPRVIRLGARIWELRHEHGYEIESNMINVWNSEQKKCRVKQYWLVELPWR